MSDSPATPGQSQTAVADHNSRTVLEALRRGGPLSRQELAEAVGLTAPGIGNVLKRLLAEGLVGEASPRRTTRGGAYALRPEGAFAAGARLRDGHIDGLLVDLSGAEQGHACVGRTGNDGADIAKLVSALEESNQHPAGVFGLGLVAADFSGVDGAGIREALGGRSVRMEIDTVATILAERMAGAVSPNEGMILILIEDRIRSGLFLHGVPFAGVHGRAGRIGEMRTGGGRRTLDEVASARAYRAAVETPDGVARWIERAAEHLLDAILSLSGLVAPRLVLIAGDLPDTVVDALIEDMRRLGGKPELDVYRWQHFFPIISRASVGTGGALRGAALLPLFDRYLPEPFPARSRFGDRPSG